MRRVVLILLPVLLPACPQVRATPDPLAVLSSGKPTPEAIVAAAPARAWRTIDPADLVVMDLAGGGRVTIQLAPAFAPTHIANIGRLIATRWFDSTSVNRVQDNYVVQWGDASENKPRPTGFVAHPPAEYQRSAQGLRITPLAARDPYAPAVGFADGWPVGRDPARGQVWLAHCYAMVGVGRDLPPDTGDGSELYAVIGQAPRQLDRNIALVGRVIGGLSALDTLPRGHAALGFYDSPAKRTTILRIRSMAELPSAERQSWQVMRTDSASFTAYAAARADRRDVFYVHPAGGVALCNVPVPLRRQPP